jgi:hypothetical protein
MNALQRAACCYRERVVRRAVRLSIALGLIVLGFATGCDRNIEPFDPEEKPVEPDLSKIFPAGTQRAAETPVLMPPAPGERRGVSPPTAEASPISGTLTLGTGMEEKVRPGSVLFLIARAGTAGPPLAVVRIQNPTFPLDFEIGPDDRMIQSIPFVGPLRLTARVDGDGNAMTRDPGDLSGAAAGTHDPGDRGVQVVIDEVL